MKCVRKLALVIVCVLVLVTSVFTPAWAAPAQGPGAAPRALNGEPDTVAKSNLPSPLHDIWVARISAPTSASAYHTRTITVDVGNRYWPEAATVTVYKGACGGVAIGSLLKRVPYSRGSQAATFSFYYTFTLADAAAGHVDFCAKAVLWGFQDDYPSNNYGWAMTRVWY